MGTKEAALSMEVEYIVSVFFKDLLNLRGYLRARFFRKVFLKKKNESVLYSAANCSRELLTIIRPNSKVTLEHRVVVIISFFELQTVRRNFFTIFAPSCLVFAMFQYPVI